jgi:hypothetical protein
VVCASSIHAQTAPANESAAPTGGAPYPPLAIALFPLISSDTPQQSTPNLVSAMLPKSITASPSGPFTVTPVTKTVEAPDIPPDTADTQGCPYSMTSQLFWDDDNQQTNAQVWLYDDSTQKLVVTDQFIYANADDINMFGQSLLDYVLGLIPVYTVTVTADQGGKVKSSAGGASPYKYHGFHSATFSAVPDEGWYFQGWRINGKQSLDTSNPLTLALNTENYKGQITPDDPWASKVAVKVECLFTNDPNQAAFLGLAGKTNKGTGNETNKGAHTIYIAAPDEKNAVKTNGSWFWVFTGIQSQTAPWGVPSNGRTLIADVKAGTTVTVWAMDENGLKPPASLTYNDSQSSVNLTLKSAKDKKRYAHWQGDGTAGSSEKRGYHGTASFVMPDCDVQVNPWAATRQATAFTKLGWYLGVGWAPFVHLSGGDAYLSRDATLISFALNAGLTPFNFKGGSIGFNLDVDYARLSGNAEFTTSNGTQQLYAMDAHLASFGLNVFYRTPRFNTPFSLDASLGGGLALGFGFKTGQGATNDPAGVKVFPYFNIGFLLCPVLVGHFSLGIGADFRLLLMTGGSLVVYIVPRLSMDWRF